MPFEFQYYEIIRFMKLVKYSKFNNLHHEFPLKLQIALIIVCLQANDAITSPPGWLIRDSNAETEVKTASADWCALSGPRVHR